MIKKKKKKQNFTSIPFSVLQKICSVHVSAGIPRFDCIANLRVYSYRFQRVKLWRLTGMILNKAATLVGMFQVVF